MTQPWVPPTTLGLVAALVAAATLLTGTAGRGPASAGVERYLPSDGTAVREHTTVLSSTASGASSEPDSVAESSRRTGLAGLFGTDTAFGDRVLATVLDSARTVRVWRVTSSPTISGASPVGQSTRLYRSDDGVRLLGEEGGGSATVYAPGLLELPVDVAPGHRWTSTGTASTPAGDRAYRADLQATSADGGCMGTAGQLMLAADAGEPARAMDLTRTWCPGRGVVQSSETETAPHPHTIQTETAAVTPPTTPTAVPVVADPPRDPGVPSDWTRRDLTSVSQDPFGRAPVAAAPAVARAPVRTASGLVVRAVAATDDVLAFRLQGGRLVSVWRVHPGAALTGLAAFGDVVLAMTSGRRVVAYSAAGVRLWQLTATDLVTADAVRVGPDAVAVVDLAGHVWCLDLRTGRVRWQRAVGADVDVTPTATAGVLVVADRGGTTTGIDAGSGDVRWSRPLLADVLVVDDGVVLALAGQTITGLDPLDGRRRWLLPYAGTLAGGAPLGTAALVSTDVGTELVTPTGQVARRYPPFATLTPLGSAAVGWTAGHAQVLAADGSLGRTLELPGPDPAGVIPTVLGLPGAVLLLGSSWDVSGWIGAD